MPAGYGEKGESLQFFGGRDLTMVEMGTLLGQAETRWKKRKKRKLGFSEVVFTVSKPRARPPTTHPVSYAAKAQA